MMWSSHPKLALDIDRAHNRSPTISSVMSVTLMKTAWSCNAVAWRRDLMVESDNDVEDILHAW